MALFFGRQSPDGVALFFALATGVYMSLFGSLIGKLTPSKVEANPELERIRAGVLGAMRHADAKFSAGDAESGINTLIDAFNVAKIAFGFCDPVTQLVIHEITLQTYNVGLKEAGLKFETLRWILHIGRTTSQMQTSERTSKRTAILYRIW
jgi:hypothetical protein